MTPDEELRRGDRARQVLDNEVYIEAYQAIRDRIWSQLSLVELDPDKRVRLNSLAVALESLHKYMDGVLKNGKHVANMIEHEKTFGERVRERLRA